MGAEDRSRGRDDGLRSFRWGSGGKAAEGRLRRLGEWCARHFVIVVSDNIVVKMLGLGLAVSVLIDATVVRLLMVPAVMTLLGRHAWWTPHWLDRVLPRVDAEGERG